MDMIRYYRHVFIPTMQAKLARSERGAALVEYALLLALIAVVCIIALGFLGRSAGSKFDSVGQSIANAGA